MTRFRRTAAPSVPSFLPTVPDVHQRVSFAERMPQELVERVRHRAVFHGTQALIGSGTNAYDRFYVDGSDSEGSALAGWRTYAVDPTATPSATTGSPSGTTYFGVQWAILGSGSLKGAPNAIDVVRHGRELTCTDGDLANGYATFDGAATFDSDTTRAWGLLTPSAGGYQFHGAFVMGTTGTAVDFRDSNRSIVILDDEFVPTGFNEFEIRNASSNVEWTAINITALGTVSRGILTLDVGTFVGEACTFSDLDTTIFSSTGTAIGLLAGLLGA